jgi:mono/diheme cytochrome c family protein/glucose/arabinose dehydrogenase
MMHVGRDFGTLSIASVLASALVLRTAVGQQGDRAGEVQHEIPTAWRVAESPVLSPEEALAAFSIVDGYRIELVASEPLIEAPVAFEFGPDGRMWVVEMRGYMRDADGAGESEPLGRITVLRDRDGDGRMDEASVFLDGLVMPRGIALWRDGVLVIEPPHLLFCRDTDGDGRSDVSTVVASGFAGADNPEHAGNGLFFSLDNAFVCSQHTERFVPSGTSLRVQTVLPHGQWGLTEDAVGRLYYAPNSDPLLVDLWPKQDAARNRSQKNFEGVPARAATDTRVFPSRLTPGVNRGYQKGVLKDGRLANFTGACAPHVHVGHAMGRDMNDCALVCEVAGNLVHRYRLREESGRIVATPADGERSFLTSTDERFRPVHCEAGPDGAIYLADMYRGVIQHRKFMTTFLRSQVELRALETPLDRGRIWRIVPNTPAAADARRSVPDLTQATAVELAGMLASPEKALRTMARRLLVERCDPAAVSEVRRALLASVAERDAPDDAINLERLWTLAGCGALDADVVGAVFASDRAVLRMHVLRAAEESFDTVSLASLLRRAGEDVARDVRVQGVLSSFHLAPMLRIAMLERGLRSDLDERDMRSAVLASIGGAEYLLLRAIVSGHLLDTDGVGAHAFARELTDLLLDDGIGRTDPTALHEVLSAAAAVARGRPWLASAILERVAAKQNLNARTPTQLVARAEPDGWFRLLSDAGADSMLALANPVDRLLFWPGRADVAFVPPRVARPQELSFAELGKTLYSNCMSCHQANGRGLPPVYPPLRGSEIVHGDAETLVKIVIHGMEGPIVVDGQRYNQVMPAAPLVTDEEIAAVLSYVRSAWGNTGAPIDAATVAKVREESKGRNTPWSSRELGLAP